MNHDFQAYHEKLAPFMEYMQGLTDRPALDEVVEKLKAIDISIEELGSHVQFHNSHYRRNLIFENQHVQLFCMCWKSGQRSPIHDHAESICGVKVVTGVASETLFETTSGGHMKPVSIVEYREGVIGSQDDDTHQITNLQEEGNNLVTLHCYAPPLKRMQTFSTDSKHTQIYEPINETHIDGSGI